MNTPTTPKVAPEFISTLQENAEETVIAFLQSTHAPEEIVELARAIRLLALNLQAAQQLPGIEEYTIETINNIAKAGGVFYCASGITLPRSSTAQKTSVEK